MVRFTYYRPTASGRREGWAKFVTGLVDGGKGAKGFEGEYVPAGVEIERPVGTLILQVSPEGSVKNGYEEAQFLRLSADGKFEAVSSVFNWRREYLSLRDAYREIAQEETPEQALIVERNALIARLREIDAQLAETDGEIDDSLVSEDPAGYHGGQG